MGDKHNEMSLNYEKEIRKAMLKYGNMSHSRKSRDDHEGKYLMGCDRSTQWNIIEAREKRGDYEDHIGIWKKCWIL